jgi:serine-type D-Ala-D-Ala carboxypeptidase
MFKSIEKVIIDAAEASYFSGAVAYVEHKGKVIYNEAFGYASMLPKKRKMDKEMIFDSASLTKISTSTIILKLIDEGKLSLDSNICNWFPELFHICKDITVEHLLSHKSGLPAWYPFYTFEKNEKFISHILEVMKSEMPRAGQIVEYSDLNFILLGKLIEKIERNTLDFIIVEKLIKPLGMKTLCYNPSGDLKKYIVATEYGNQIEKEMVNKRNLNYGKWREDVIWGEVNDGNAYYYLNGVSGHAGLFSNAYDLAKLSKVYLKKTEQLLEKSFLSNELIEEALRNHSPEHMEERGLGWVIGGKELTGFGHTGFTGTSIWVVPEEELIMILLTNRLHVNNPVNINCIRTRFYKTVLESIK